MSDLETVIQLSVYKHVGGECADSACTTSDCACLDEARSLGSQIYNDIAPPLTKMEKFYSWVNVFAGCAVIALTEPTETWFLRLMTALFCIIVMCEHGTKLLTGRNTP